MNEMLRTVPIIDVSRTERKVTRVKLARRAASLRPLTWWLAGSVSLVAEVFVVLADPGALKPGLPEVEDMALNNQ
jgi:hypothetical protein